MKKSKIIIPALGVIFLSTAASVTGTVAWFTANRTKTVTAGEFAIVNTTSNLDVVLAGGVGTSADGTVVTTTDGYKLTDASFDHTVTDCNIIAPDVTGQVIGKITPLADGSLATALLRDTTNHVYTAFTWNMTFTVTFGVSASKSLGLYLDLSSTETYMHEKVVYASEHTFTTEEAGTYYSDAACTLNGVSKGNGDTIAAGTYYKAAPEKTGKGFRIAFVPSAIAGTSETGTSVGYTKIWADNESSGNCGFVDGSDTATEGTTALSKTSYAQITTKLSGHTGSVTSAVAASELTSGTILMDSSKTGLGIPADNAVNESGARALANYMGKFDLAPGKSVSITFTCIAFYDGTDIDAAGAHIVTAETNFENIVTSMKFGVADLAAA